jgi:hypothetical protein
MGAIYAVYPAKTLEKSLIRKFFLNPLSGRAELYQESPKNAKL